MFDEILSSLKGTAKTRISDPIIGSFLISWCIFNWKPLALLFFGNGKAYERIEIFYQHYSESDFLQEWTIFIWPFSFTFFYLLVFPWLSLCVKSIQSKATKLQHKQAVELDIVKANQQELLNKALLRADPDKRFLEEAIQLEFQRETIFMEKEKERVLLLESMAKNAAEIAAKSKSDANISRIEEEKKLKQVEIERQRFEISNMRNQSTLASHRFPSAYFFMDLIERSLKDDEYTVSLSFVGDVVAAIFGYDDLHAILNDSDFCNENFSNVSYIYYDENILVKRLEEIISDISSGNEGITTEAIYDHIQMIFEKLPYEFISADSLAELARESIEADSYDLLAGDGVSGAIAESDTIFEEVYVEGILNSHLEDGFNVELDASASGHHRKEYDIPGRSMRIHIKVSYPAIIGKYCLGPMEVDEVHGALVDLWDDENEPNIRQLSFEV
ncbi:hypothetical protein [Aeromonas popoffii]|uniref:hypothetical protein n=1 Tax=Aeromonas popoffii TaxID=70856 RepID=UPI000A5BF6CE|nr:hypothetical protein [Aeromonas popoffii]